MENEKLETFMEFWNFLRDENNRGALGLLGTVIVVGGGYLKFLRPRKNKTDVNSGGHGGAAKVFGSGTAIGGRGGNAFGRGEGRGGAGGGAEINGSGTAIGGDGGEAGGSFRPALGAPSPFERDSAMQDLDPKLVNEMTDQYGIWQPGRGGDSHVAFVTVKGREYSLNILLRLVRIWNEQIIHDVDAICHDNEQEWWESAMKLFPVETKRAMEHVRDCEGLETTDALPQKALISK